MHEKSRELVAVAVQAEEHSQAQVVDAALERAVHGLGMPVVVMLGSPRMELQVVLLVVRLLEQDVGADLGLLEHAVLVHRGRGDVHVDAADRAVLVLHGVDGADGVEDVLDGVVARILARLDGEALVAHVLQRDDLVADLVLRELDARDGLVDGMVRAVEAAVDAVVREVERGEEHDAVAVVGQLDLARQVEDALIDRRIVAGEQHGRLAVRDDGAVVLVGMQVGLALLEDLLDELHVVLVFVGVGERVEDLLVVDELVRAVRIRIVDVGHCGSSLFWLGTSALAVRCLYALRGSPRSVTTL